MSASTTKSNATATNPHAHKQFWRMMRWFITGEWRAHPLRVIVSICAIAIGVALGFSIELINAAAFNEFSAVLKSISGQSDLQVRGTEANFDEALYPWLMQHEGVALANPVVEIEAMPRGEKNPLTILGIDVFRATAITPDLIGVPADGKPFDTLSDDAIFLSSAAMEWLHVKPGDNLQLLSGTQIVTLRVAGGLIHARSGQRIAVMDISVAQWRFNRLGKLSRIDLKLTEGVNRAVFKSKLSEELQGKNVVSETMDQEVQTSNMSRAYRVNLSVLAMVALFTGAFLIFSTQALSVIRRRQQFAFLRVMGLTRRQLLLQILLEGATVGILGSILGIVSGYAFAATTLHFFGGDLGGGYFPGIKPSVQFTPVAAAVFFILGTGIALLGSISPAWEAANAKPAGALKSGNEDGALATLSSPFPAIVCLIIALIFTKLPPVWNLPIFGYLAIGLLLIGGIALMPRLAAIVFSILAHYQEQHLPKAVISLSVARLANTPNQASIALGGVLSSFSLMVAMAIMVASFRVSVDDWLVNLLSADIYVRAAATTTSTGLNPEEQERITTLPGIATASYLRSTLISLDSSHPNVMLMARNIDVTNPGKVLAMAGASLAPGRLPANTLPIWVSEAMVDLYGWTPGRIVKLPLGGKQYDVVVAGVWRDYARQTGSIQLRLTDYRAATGDKNINDIALTLQNGVTTLQLIKALRALPFGDVLDIAEAGDIRARALKIFDRSFAVTYLLEAIAMVIGLFGIAATFSAQTFARAKEFGMLRHIGVTRRQILAMLTLEGSLLTIIGIAAGFVLGLAISLILVFIVNPESFHWTMQFHLPAGLLFGVAMMLFISACLTALVSGRYAVSGSAVQAVREDW